MFSKIQGNKHYQNETHLGSIFISPLHHMCPYYGVGWNIIKNNLNNFSKSNF